MKPLDLIRRFLEENGFNVEKAKTYNRVIVVQKGVIWVGSVWKPNENLVFPARSQKHMEQVENFVASGIRPAPTDLRYFDLHDPDSLQALLEYFDDETRRSHKRVEGEVAAV